MSQVSQDVDIDDIFPPGQKRRALSHPRDDEEMLTSLKTNARNEPQVLKTLGMVKTHVSYEQNVKNLTGANKEDLRKTLGFLIGSSNMDDVRVSKYKVEGLRLAVMTTLVNLMPKFCEDCEDENPYYQRPGDSPEVTCIRCDQMACPRCVKKESFTSNRIKYVCKKCEDIIVKQDGIDAIDKK